MSASIGDLIQHAHEVLGSIQYIMPDAECISDGGGVREPCECEKQSDGLLTGGGAA